jgi:hypothetical protein
MPHLREARDAGLTITVVCKWYHRRAVHVLRTLLPDAGGFYAVTFKPVYGDTAVARSRPGPRRPGQVTVGSTSALTGPMRR